MNCKQLGKEFQAETYDKLMNDINTKTYTFIGSFVLPTKFNVHRYQNEQHILACDNFLSLPWNLHKVLIHFEFINLNLCIFVLYLLYCKDILLQIGSGMVSIVITRLFMMLCSVLQAVNCNAFFCSMIKYIVLY